MSKIEELQKALDLLKGQDLETLKNTLALIGELPNPPSRPQRPSANPTPKIPTSF